MADEKPKRGRPTKAKPPKPIPAGETQAAVKSLVKTRSKAERKTLAERADKAAS